MGGTALRLFFASTLLAGCGKVNDTPPPVDGSTIDADQSGNATIVTQAALFGGTIGAKVSDIDIVSMLPNNMVLATAKTDANGSATIKVYPGGSVTAIYKHVATIDPGADLITWAGVKPGDTLTFGSRVFSTAGQTSTTLGTQTYSWPAFTGASSYDVFTSCTGIGTAATSVVGSESSLCHREPMDVLYGAFGAGGLIAYNFRSNVPFANGGSVAIGGWSPVATGSISVTGLPAEITSVSGNFRTILDSNDEVSLGGSYNGTPTGGAFSGTFNWHPTGERSVGLLSLNRNGFSAMHVYDSFSASTLTQTVAAPSLTPWLQSSPTASAALRTANWFLVPEASSVYDGQVLHLNWNHTVAAMNVPFQWSIILPPGPTAIDLPALPAQFNDSLPATEDFLSAQIRVFDIQSATGYDQIRAMPSANIMCLDCAVRAGDLQRIVYTP
jgi:hypothetical protein